MNKSKLQPITTYPNTTEEWQKINNQIADLYIQLEIARMEGDDERVKFLQRRIENAYNKQNKCFGRYTVKGWSK